MGIYTSFKETLGTAIFLSGSDMPERRKNEDEIRLNKLGYKQEAKRIFGVWTNFGLAASMISVLLGIIPLYGYSLQNGGESVIIWIGYDVKQISELDWNLACIDVYVSLIVVFT
jgi:hypothetical protein